MSNGGILFVVLVVVLIAIRMPRRKKFDRERRELRLGWQTPIPFRDLEVRVFSYRQEENPMVVNRIIGGLRGGMAGEAEEMHRVYVAAGGRVIDLELFRSKEKAE